MKGGIWRHIWEASREAGWRAALDATMAIWRSRLSIRAGRIAYWWLRLSMLLMPEGYRNVVYGMACEMERWASDTARYDVWKEKRGRGMPYGEG